MKKRNIALFVMAGAMLASCGANVNVADAVIEEEEESTVLADSHLLEMDSLDGAENGKGDLLRKNAISTQDGVFKIKSATLAMWNCLDIAFTVANVPTGSKSHGIYFWLSPKASLSAYAYDGTNTDGYQATLYDTAYGQEGHDDYWSLNGASRAENDTHMNFGQFTDYVYAVAWSFNGTSYTNSAPVKYSALTYAENKKDSTTELSNGMTIAQYLPTLRSYAFSCQSTDKQTKRPATGTYSRVALSGANISDGFSEGLYRSNETVVFDGYYYRTSDTDMTMMSQFGMEGADLSDLSFTKLDVQGSAGLAIENGSLIGPGSWTGSTLVVPDGVTGSDTFQCMSGCGMTALSLPNGYAGTEADFYGCSNLKMAVLRGSTNNISYSEFHTCKNLKAICLEGKAGYVAPYAFYDDAIQLILLNRNVISSFAVLKDYVKANKANLSGLSSLNDDAIIAISPSGYTYEQCEQLIYNNIDNLSSISSYITDAVTAEVLKSQLN